MRTPALPRDEVISRLADVFRHAGYVGASLSELSRVTGMQRASLYYHFPGGKKDMARAVLQQLADMLSNEIIQPLRETTDKPQQKLRRMTVVVDKIFDGGKKNSIIAAFALGGACAIFQKELAHIVNEWAEALITIAVEAGVPEDIAHKRAYEGLSQLQGALLVSRTLGNIKIFREMLNSFPEQLLAQ